MGWREPGLGRTAVPVLCYHSIGGNGVAPDLFAAQMRWLKAKGARTLRLHELAAFMAGDLELDGPAVAVTFDDGFRDILTHAAPVLADLGFTCVVFVITSRIRPDNEPGQEGNINTDAAHEGFVLRGERGAWLSGPEIRSLADQGVAEMGSHGVRHVKGPISGPELLEVPDHWAFAAWREPGSGPAPRMASVLAKPQMLEQGARLETGAEFSTRVEQELRQSREELETLLNRPVTSLAWPWGAFTSASMEAARAVGFTQCFTTERGSVTPGLDPLRLPRLEVRSARPLRWFKTRLHLYSRARLGRLYTKVRL